MYLLTAASTLAAASSKAFIVGAGGVRMRQKKDKQCLVEVDTLTAR